MRKLFITLAFAGFALGTQAQEATPEQKYSVATNSFWSNWFIQTGALGTAMKSTVWASPTVRLRSSAATRALLSPSVSGSHRASDSAPSCKVSGARLSLTTTTPAMA